MKMDRLVVQPASGASDPWWRRAAARLGAAPTPSTSATPAPARIEFRCAPEDLGIIAEPVPAKAVLPDWFRRLPAVDKGELTATNSAITIKRCMPFLDALQTGWILPLAATVRLEVKDKGQTVDAGWEFDKVMVSNHAPFQVAGNPLQPRPPCKFHNYWTVRTPPGWSCLFVPPLNRPEPAFECLAGVVDTDLYPTHIHFPFFATEREGVYVIQKGTPLVQVIPFRRDDAAIEGVVEAERPDDAEARSRGLRATEAADGWYRKEARAPR